MTKPIAEMDMAEFERYVDEGGDVSALFQAPAAEILHPVRNDEQRVVNATLPAWLVELMDDEASRRGISRKAVINNWLVDRADQEIERRKTA